jgi:hypothetical protein
MTYEVKLASPQGWNNRYLVVSFVLRQFSPLARLAQSGSSR